MMEYFSMHKYTQNTCTHDVPQTHLVQVLMMNVNIPYPHPLLATPSNQVKERMHTLTPIHAAR